MRHPLDPQLPVPLQPSPGLTDTTDRGTPRLLFGIVTISAPGSVPDLFRGCQVDGMPLTEESAPGDERTGIRFENPRQLAAPGPVANRAPR